MCELQVFRCSQQSWVPRSRSNGKNREKHYVGHKLKQSVRKTPSYGVPYINLPLEFKPLLSLTVFRSKTLRPDCSSHVLISSEAFPLLISRYCYSCSALSYLLFLSTAYFLAVKSTQVENRLCSALGSQRPGESIP